MALQDMLRDNTKKVFSTMLSLELMEIEENPDIIDTDEHWLEGSLFFGGSILGDFRIQLREGYSKKIASVMLGIDTIDIKSENEVQDVIKEIANMIGGNLRTQLSASGIQCDISPPKVDRRQNLNHNIPAGGKFARIFFTQGINYIITEVHLRPYKI
ncbi:MAG: chemotaxis protein CheX [Spirochaetales bacterium]|nr:chemotaxis protein CheX [Spirochaetales bacterium]